MKSVGFDPRAKGAEQAWACLARLRGSARPNEPSLVAVAPQPGGSDPRDPVVGRRSRGPGAWPAAAGCTCGRGGALPRPRAEPPGGALPRAGPRRGLPDPCGPPSPRSAFRRRSAPRRRAPAALRGAAVAHLGSPQAGGGDGPLSRPERLVTGGRAPRPRPGSAGGGWVARPLCLQGGGRVRGARGGSLDALPVPRAAVAAP